ncbi:MAG: hypothetical protein BVN29_18485 [Nitrospira sp. ST-bin5]|nr:MAG: hypothetical protein BVN29_18485 [Nitrospira sp. ST-bin5]
MKCILTILATLLFLSSDSALAEWIAIAKMEKFGVTIYVDPNTIRRVGDRVMMWQLWDFKTSQTVADYNLLSTKTYDEFDCLRERSRRLAFIDYSDNMGRGLPI